MTTMQEESPPRNSSASTSDWIGQVKGHVIYAYDLSTLVSETGGKLYPLRLNAPLAHLSWAEVMARLEKFHLLGPNWDSYDADPIAPVAIERARGLLLSLRQALGRYVGERFLPLNVVPLVDGGVQLEWQSSARSLEVEITASGDLVCFQAQGSDPNRTTYEKEGADTAEVQQLVASIVIP